MQIDKQKILENEEGAYLTWDTLCNFFCDQGFPALPRWERRKILDRLTKRHLDLIGQSLANKENTDDDGIDA